MTAQMRLGEANVAYTPEHPGNTTVEVGSIRVLHQDAWPERTIIDLPNGVRMVYDGNADRLSLYGWTGIPMGTGDPDSAAANAVCKQAVTILAETVDNPEVAVERVEGKVTGIEIEF